MPVRLDKVPAALDEPSTPRVWLWGLSLPALMALGVVLALWLGPDALTQYSLHFWWWALGAPVLVWCGAVFWRGLLYLGQLSVVEGWNEAREVDLTQRMRRGRRSQQVLAVSLQTALRAPEADGQAQRISLLAKNGGALRTQAGWRGQQRRHSRLPWLEHENEHQLLQRVLSTLLGELADTLAAFPPEVPVSLLLEMNSELSSELMDRLWRESLEQSGIRQAITRIDGSGLAAIDHWLDQRIRDRALLLVVAIQVAPPVLEGAAEAAVGLLFGNRLTQDVLPPRAYLHRPERARERTPAGALTAAFQALDWVPLPGTSIGRVWITGADAAHGAVITTVMEKASLPAQASHDLGELLGNPGNAAPWVAIAAAVEATASEAVPHFIFSVDREEDVGLWCSVVMPAEAPGE
ncbi:hypothetical protein [Pseudomonas sp. LFM046]|uniref:hypothetical protein n=1 Tax=Pseudomonas sp. LFM046 TaxID=1608357 RepID=UPI0005CFD32A|nr:hypothetical protein [Pseudomonas sp. LFM046]